MRSAREALISLSLLSSQSLVSVATCAADKLVNGTTDSKTADLWCSRTSCRASHRTSGRPSILLAVVSVVLCCRV